MHFITDCVNCAESYLVIISKQQRTERSSTHYFGFSGKKQTKLVVLKCVADLGLA